MTKTMAESIATLVSAGLSVEDAVKAVTLLGGAKTATTKVQPKAEGKATTKAQPKAEKVGGITKMAQPKAESKATTKAQPKAENGKALVQTCKFTVEKTVRTDDANVTVWRVSLAERVSKTDWADLNAFFGATFDAGYWRGGWSCPVDPTKVLAGGKLTAKQSKVVADRKADRKATREARKASGKGA